MDERVEAFHKRETFFYHFRFLEYYDSFVCQWAVSDEEFRGPVVRDYYIIHYCTRGRGTFYIDYCPYTLEEGQCLVIYPHKRVVMVADPENPWSFVYIGVTGLMIPTYLQRAGITENKIIFPWRGNQKVLNAMMAIASLKKAPNGWSSILSPDSYANMKDNLIRQNYLNEIFIECFQENEKLQPYVAENKYVQQAREYMSSNFHKPITVREIAAHIGLTRNYFCMLFKQYMGKSPQEYLADIRVKKACLYLENPSFSIAEIAYSLGYEDAASFSRMFRRIMGVSPSRYRQRTEPESSASNCR